MIGENVNKNKNPCIIRHLPSWCGGGVRVVGRQAAGRQVFTAMFVMIKCVEKPMSSSFSFSHIWKLSPGKAKIQKGRQRAQCKW